ncbi:ABC transporter permease [Aggregatibacter actinomycetemcomitans]|nr:ABC transporter permease [Aggregatibacter actinomycetemcomitans]
MQPVKLSYAFLGKLALRDLYYDRKVSFCIIASLIAVIAPLLLLFSLKFGVVSQLRHQLINDPRNLEIKIIGNLNLDKNWFDWLQQQPETRFVVPLTRSLNTIADLSANQNGAKTFVQDVEVIPTAPNDPLTETPLAQPKGVLLSALTAEKLKVNKGDKIHLVVTRSQHNQVEKAIAELVVEGIVAETRFPRAGAFVQLDTLLAMEDFRDGYQTAVFANQADPPREQPREHFARARIYANGLDDVAPLALKLRQKHIETTTEANAIENVKAIDGVLNVIFMVIAATAVLGCVLSLIGAFLANIDRKRKEIALLRLFGFQTGAVILYLIMQALCLSGIAFVLSYLLFLSGSQVFNFVLGQNLSSDIFISSLHFIHLLIAFAIALFLAAIVAGIGARQAVSIQPAESLRDV